MIRTGGSKVTRPLQYVALLGYMVFLAFPLLFLLTTAFKSTKEIRSRLASERVQLGELP